MAVDHTSNEVQFEVLSMEDSSCWRLARILNTMFANPSYQRQGAIWTRRRKQVFVDSLINGFDIPKIYLHEGGDERDGKRYAIVDGKQRLEALSDFYQGRLRLAEDFRLFNIDKIDELDLDNEDLDRLAGSTYSEIESSCPAVAKYLDQRKLDVRIIRTEDTDVIEELFWRLNDAATLNGPEHRRGIGGPGVDAIDDLVAHEFYKCLPFSDRRYRHQDLAAKMLLWSAPTRLKRATGSRGEIPDTKRGNLDRLVRLVRDDGSELQGPEQLLAQSVADAKIALDALSPHYSKPDRTLARLGTVAVVFLHALRLGRGASSISRVVSPDDLASFELYRERIASQYQDEDSMPLGALVLQDYGSLAQSSNDGAALRRRVEILETYVSAVDNGDEPIEALGRL